MWLFRSTPEYNRFVQLCPSKLYQVGKTKDSNSSILNSPSLKMPLIKDPTEVNRKRKAITHTHISTNTQTGSPLSSAYSPFSVLASCPCWPPQDCAAGLPMGCRALCCPPFYKHHLFKHIIQKNITHHTCDNLMHTATIEDDVVFGSPFCLRTNAVCVLRFS